MEKTNSSDKTIFISRETIKRLISDVRDLMNDPLTDEGIYYKHDEEGTYNCNCCKNALFSSTVKYDSGSGWPSFWDAIDKKNIKTKDDYSLGHKRIEIMCANCDAHLGHVFEDGPNPTGFRYCVNSLSLDFKKND